MGQLGSKTGSDTWPPHQLYCDCFNHTFLWFFKAADKSGEVLISRPSLTSVAKERLFKCLPKYWL